MNPLEERNAPDFHPFDDEDVALVVEACAVRTDEQAVRKFRAREFPALPVIVGPLPEVADQVVVPIEQRDPRREVRHDHRAVGEEIEVARQVHALAESEVVTFQVEILQTVIRTIRNQQFLRSRAIVDRNAVRAVQFAGTVAASPESALVVAILVVVQKVA